MTPEELEAEKRRAFAGRLTVVGDILTSAIFGGGDGTRSVDGLVNTPYPRIRDIGKASAKLYLRKSLYNKPLSYTNMGVQRFYIKCVVCAL